MKKIINFYLLAFLMVSQNCFGAQLVRLSSKVAKLALTTRTGLPFLKPALRASSTQLSNIQDPQETTRWKNVPFIQRAEAKKCEEKETKKLGEHINALLRDAVLKGEIDTIKKIFRENSKTFKALKELYEAIELSDCESPGYFDKLEKLLQGEVNPNGYTCAHDGIFNNPLKIVNLVLDVPTLQMKDGRMKVYNADTINLYKKIKALLEKTGIREYSPLEFARKYKGSKSFAETVLIKFGAFDPEQV